MLILRRFSILLGVMAMAKPNFAEVIGDAGSWLADNIRNAGDWVASQARGFWRWSKKHPILASAFLALVLTGVAFPPIYAFLPSLPFVGPFVMSLIASAPAWSVPITLAFTVLSAAVSTVFVVSVVSLFKKIFGGGPAAGGGTKVEPWSGDVLDNDPDEFDDNNRRQRQPTKVSTLDPDAGDFEIVNSEEVIQKESSPQSVDDAKSFDLESEPKNLPDQVPNVA